MYLGGIDITYLIFVVPALILSMIASGMVKSRFAKYDKIMSKKGCSGAEAAAILLKANGILDVKIRHIGGTLTDNYNPSTKTLNLSDSTFSSRSIAAIGVAAHETGHAIQHDVGYGPLVLRSTMVPAANFGSRLGPWLVIIGLILSGSGRGEVIYMLSIWQHLIDIGIILFAVSVLFYVVTLPVEFNASRRALAILKDTGVFAEDELKGAKKVLSAAAMTYVASALAAIGSLIRLLVISRSRQRRR